MISAVLNNSRTWHVETVDCRAGLRSLPDGCIQCCATSPPFFGLRDYGLPPSVWGGDAECEHAWGGSHVVSMGGGVGNGTLAGTQHGDRKGGDLRFSAQSSFCQKCSAWLGCLGLEPTPGLFITHLVEVCREIRRVLRSDGVFWLNLGDSYSSHGAGSAGKELAYMGDAAISRKARNAPPGFKPKDLIGIPWAAAFALRADGWYLRAAVPWVKRSAMPDSTTDRPGSALEYVFLLTKSPRYYFDHGAVRRAPSGISGGAAFGKVELDGPGSRRCDQEDRERYAAQGRQWRNGDLWFDSVDPPHGMTFVDDELVGLDVNPEGFKEAHFATWPTELVRPLLKSSTSEKGCCAQCGKSWERILDHDPGDNEAEQRPKHLQGGKSTLSLSGNGSKEWAERGGKTTTLGWQHACKCDCADTVPSLVLDPFSGAGTTVMVARRLGLRAIGFEAKEEYAAMGRRRVRDDAPLLNC